MKYMGSKARFAKELLPIILKDRKPEQWYVEPFAGGMNMIDKVTGNRIANDISTELIELFKAVVNGWIPPLIETKEEYKHVRENKDNYDLHFLGWVGFGCSYSGKWFAGFAGDYRTGANYQKESVNTLSKQSILLQNVVFSNKQYFEIEYPENSTIYCDPPYQGTTSYKNKFDHVKFWNWIRKMSILGHTVFVSEYNAPEDFVCVWQKEASSQLSANGKFGGSKISTEKLFTYGFTY